MQHKITLLDDNDYDLEDDAPAEIDFSKTTRIRRGFHPFMHMVSLEPEVAAAFPTPEAVNEALRRVMREMQQAA